MLLGVAGAIVAAIIGAWAVLRARHPAGSRLELLDVTAGAGILDLKVRNTGGQSAVLKRLHVHIDRACPLHVEWVLYAFERFSVEASVMPVTATYDVVLPAPGQLAAEASVTANLSQVVKPGDADRFQVAVGQRPYQPSAVYLMRLELSYDVGRSLRSAPLAIAVPAADSQAAMSPDDIRRAVVTFRKQVERVRGDIDADLVAAGMQAADWVSAPPVRREELPEQLPTIDSKYSRIYDEFWDPPRAVARYLDGIEQRYRALIEIAEAAAVVQDEFAGLLATMRLAVAELPAIRSGA